ncbi:uncharacterized protein MONOS_1051 [Monocercomonoides exilis]|uniref:uncharacterized protein n=1 Tax=Monocercomonoides exilis TaxID=2049356 RepID=UPI00355A7879|nr:hypothetical protein MONOS_1051 [Monocercomonoides exilis]|eukprot:MONOS_1051.1-p1 / transcript=MONOS_1051.1 / gene=MONOS_1051 / organism=Monocercomonoides_exilis_PA203 / gene_product=unspecified product / transcript_product=unspecified product / location=Mono_scaffold00017:249576-251220(+) / protein_length=518 / sequence_SO=supercontig / SO=protein_coding / is_pseudo=false
MNDALGSSEESSQTTVDYQITLVKAKENEIMLLKQKLAEKDAEILAKNSEIEQIKKVILEKEQCAKQKLQEKDDEISNLKAEIESQSKQFEDEVQQNKSEIMQLNEIIETFQKELQNRKCGDGNQDSQVLSTPEDHNRQSAPEESLNSLSLLSSINSPPRASSSLRSSSMSSLSSSLSSSLTSSYTVASNSSPVAGSWALQSPSPLRRSSHATARRPVSVPQPFLSTFSSASFSRDYSPTSENKLLSPMTTSSPRFLSPITPFATSSISLMQTGDLFFTSPAHITPPFCQRTPHVSSFSGIKSPMNSATTLTPMSVVPKPEAKTTLPQPHSPVRQPPARTNLLAHLPSSAKNADASSNSKINPEDSASSTRGLSPLNSTNGTNATISSNGINELGGTIGALQISASYSSEQTSTPTSSPVKDSSVFSPHTPPQKQTLLSLTVCTLSDVQKSTVDAMTKNGVGEMHATIALQANSGNEIQAMNWIDNHKEESLLDLIIETQQKNSRCIQISPVIEDSE